LDPSDPHWRYTALKSFFEQSPTSQGGYLEGDTDFFEPLPSLRNLCLDILLEIFNDPTLNDDHDLVMEPTLDFAQDNLLAQLLPYIPPNAVRLLARRAVIHHPLTGPTLLSFYEHGSADGEIILFGPVVNNKLVQALISPSESSSSTTVNSVTTSWDDDGVSSKSFQEPVSLTSLAILSPSLPSAPQLSLNFPPTITHLSLLHLPTAPSTLSRIPSALPLLEFLDLSYNSWLLPPPALSSISSTSRHRSAQRVGSTMASSSEGRGLVASAISSGFPISRLHWAQCTHLRYIGLREVGHDYVSGTGFRNEEVREGVRKLICESVKRREPCIVDFG